MEKLRKSRIPYLVVDYRSIKEQQYAIEMIGKAVGAQDKAARYNEYYRKCIDLVQKKVAGIPGRDRVRVYTRSTKPTEPTLKILCPQTGCK
ncbi:MAG: hypothetical protein K6T65_05370 [Peptococcaceae bacterium]|nr:hypothetical protein [Peptococcaceae bacterium]